MASPSWTRRPVSEVLLTHFAGEWGEDPGGDPNVWVLRATNLVNGGIDYETAAPRRVPSAAKAKKQLIARDILLEVSGGSTDQPVGRVARFTANGGRTYCCSNFFRTLRPDPDSVDADYLYWALLRLYHRPEVRLIQRQTTGIINLNVPRYLALELDLPLDLSEQRRIAELLMDVEQSIHDAEATIVQRHRARSALAEQLLAPCFSGDGEEVGILDLASLPSGQVDPRKSPYSGWTLIAPDHIESRTGRLMQASTATEQGAISGKYLVGPNDVLYSKIRPHLRKAAFPGSTALCSADMYPLRPKDGVAPRFLLAVLLSDAFSRFAEAASTRSGFPKINRQELAAFRLRPLGPDDQDRLVGALKAADDVLEGEYRAVDHLRRLQRGLMDDLLTGSVLTA